MRTDITALRLTARHILANAPKFDWSLQGFGLLRLYLPGDGRFHIWNHRYAYNGVSMIHDHLQWGLTSTIVSGRLINIRYKEGAGSPYHWMQIKAGFNPSQLSEVDTMRLAAQPPEIYGPGDMYHQEPNEVHETWALPGTVTVMQKFPTPDGETARIFWPEGTKWVSAEPRPATGDEICAFAAKALELL